MHDLAPPKSACYGFENHHSTTPIKSSAAVMTTMAAREPRFAVSFEPCGDDALAGVFSSGRLARCMSSSLPCPALPLPHPLHPLLPLLCLLRATRTQEEKITSCRWASCFRARIEPGLARDNAKDAKGAGQSSERFAIFKRSSGSGSDPGHPIILNIHNRATTVRLRPLLTLPYPLSPRGGRRSC
jgi:hypothetical protein